jgi:hypothetical protein
MTVKHWEASSVGCGEHVVSTMKLNRLIGSCIQRGEETKQELGKA